MFASSQLVTQGRSWQLKRSKNCSELTCDSPRPCRFYNHSPTLSPSHSPRSPSRSPFVLNLLHRVQRQRGSKISGAPAGSLFDAFSTFDQFPVPRAADPRTFQLPLPMKYKIPFPPSRATSSPPPECDPPRTVVLLLPSLRPSNDDLLESCDFHHCHGPAEPAGAHGGRTATCSC